MAELKNTSKGLWAEVVVALHFYRQGAILMNHRIRLLHGEVDLIFKKDKYIYFIEVKTLHTDMMAFERIQSAQLNRLRRNAISYYQTSLKSVVVCFVRPNAIVECIDIN